MDRTSLGDRIKSYENIERRYLPRRAPVIIRVDGKSFHTYTYGFEKPFDESFLWCMRMTMLDLCKNIMGCKLGYHQSDEITLLLTDDDTIDTEPWFGKNLQKMVSISAAMATYFFNRHVNTCSTCGLETPAGQIFSSKGLHEAWRDKRIAIFDSRVFTIPREEVLNAFEFRQQDCTRNSIQSVGQTYFSHNQLFGKSCNDIQNMLLTEHNINWNDYEVALKRGVCARKVKKNLLHKTWELDMNIPIFNQQPDYVEDIVYHRGDYEVI